MNETLLSLYILIWPAISAVIAVILVVAAARDVRRAREEGHDVV